MNDKHNTDTTDLSIGRGEFGGIYIRLESNGVMLEAQPSLTQWVQFIETLSARLRAELLQEKRDLISQGYRDKYAQKGPGNAAH